MTGFRVTSNDWFDIELPVMTGLRVTSNVWALVLQVMSRLYLELPIVTGLTELPVILFIGLDE